MDKQVKDLLNKCDNCKLKECIACEFTYTDIQKIKKYVEETESILDKVTDKLKEDKKELMEELKYNITKREARIQLNLVDKYLEIIIEGGKQSRREKI